MPVEVEVVAVPFEVLLVVSVNVPPVAFRTWTNCTSFWAVRLSAPGFSGLTFVPATPVPPENSTVKVLLTGRGDGDRSADERADHAREVAAVELDVAGRHAVVGQLEGAADRAASR